MLTFSCDARSISSESRAICCAMSLDDSALALPDVVDGFVKFVIGADEGSIVSSLGCSKSPV